jgi:hypothetical protein
MYFSSREYNPERQHRASHSEFKSFRENSKPRTWNFSSHSVLPTFNSQVTDTNQYRSQRPSGMRNPLLSNPWELQDHKPQKPTESQKKRHSSSSVLYGPRSPPPSYHKQDMGSKDGASFVKKTPVKSPPMDFTDPNMFPPGYSDPITVKYSDRKPIKKVISCVDVSCWRHLLLVRKKENQVQYHFQ